LNRGLRISQAVVGVAWKGAERKYCEGVVAKDRVVGEKN